jgi:hypothetical protein
MSLLPSGFPTPKNKREALDDWNRAGSGSPVREAGLVRIGAPEISLKRI